MFVPVEPLQQPGVCDASDSTSVAHLEQIYQVDTAHYTILCHGAASPADRCQSRLRLNSEPHPETPYTRKNHSFLN